MKEILTNALKAKKIVANLDENLRNEVLHAMAESIKKAKSAILEANKLDMNNAINLSHSMMERLRLDGKKIDSMSDSISVIAGLKSPLGRVLDGYQNHAGLRIRKITVPIGVVAVVYESRPNVTSDVSALCFKSGNACILKGGKEAKESNKAILEALHNTLKAYHLPTSIIGFVDSRECLESLLKEDKYIDLIIPRGGEGLISFVSSHSKIPIIKHDKGVCTMYIDKTCDKKDAIAIAINAKTSKPAACNSIETILVHRDCDILDSLIASLKAEGITLKAPPSIASAFDLSPIGDDDFYKEYGDNTLNIKIVENIDEAMEHIRTYGSFHSDCIITDDYKNAERFLNEVDSACVFVNASTRFSDGGEFGFGAEVGISTSKIHARGPMGIDSLTTYKYQIYGDGQIRI